MSFFVLLVGLFALLHVPWLGRLLGAWVPAETRRDRARVAAAVAFIVASLPHFLTPARYLPMMPPWLSDPLLLIYLSGLAELAGGVGLLVPATRRMAAWWLVAVLVAIFPANVHVALSGANAEGLPSASWYIWSRLPFQAIFIWWVLASTRRGEGAATQRRTLAAQTALTGGTQR